MKFIVVSLALLGLVAAFPQKEGSAYTQEAIRQAQQTQLIPKNAQIQKVSYILYPYSYYLLFHMYVKFITTTESILIKYDFNYKEDIVSNFTYLLLALILFISKFCKFYIELAHNIRCFLKVFFQPLIN